MSSQPAVQVQGARQLRATLAKAGADLGDFAEIHQTVARYVGSRAAAYAPKRSGRLAATMRPSKAKTSATVRFGGASVPYAGVIHWGWAGHNIAANPFASKAAEETQPTWLAWYSQRINQVVAAVKGAPGP